MLSRPGQSLTFDAENRLVAVSGSATASFTYNGDGARVKSVVGSTMTVFVGEYLEWDVSTSSIKKYYFAGGRRIALRQSNGELLWLIGDHLGSTTLTADVNGGNVQRQLYKGWGETRSTTTVATMYAYTGQYRYDDQATEFGLLFYRSRFYDGSLGRFVSADSIIPEASQGVQAWDRYAGMNNNPVRWNDPSGHDVGCSAADPKCDAQNFLPPPKIPISTHPPPSQLVDPTIPSFEPYIPRNEIKPNDGSSTPIDSSTDDFTGFWEIDRLNAIGVRGDLSGWIPVFPIIGGDVGVDIVFSDETSVYFTPSLMTGIGEGVSFSIGLVGYYDTPKPEDAKGPGYGAQANLTIGGGINLSYGYSDQPGSSGQHSQTWSLAPSFLAQIGGSTLLSYTLLLIP